MERERPLKEENPKLEWESMNPNKFSTLFLFRAAVFWRKIEIRERAFHNRLMIERGDKETCKIAKSICYAHKIIAKKMFFLY